MNAGTEPTSLPLKRLRSGAVLPAYQSTGAAGMDLCACVEESGITIQPGEIRFVPTGWAAAVPPGYEAQIRPRSGLAGRHGMTLPNSPGTIDSDYRGEIIVPMINHGHEPFHVSQGMRIAQMVIAPVVRSVVVEVESLDQTLRGTGGFGSTGVR
ncbi:MAG: dUTP diphosphatase [Phycisphaerae bacterium]|nr:dUTP diphosphatase [Phycisphaerae bacterium]